MIKKFITTLGVVVTFIFSGYQFLDQTYARANSLQQLEQKVNRYQLEATYQKALDHYYNTRALSLKYPDNEELKIDLIKAKDQLDYLKGLLGR